MISRTALRRKIRITWRSMLRKLVEIMHMRNTPEAIAGGMALGLFIAFTPTVGFQIIMVIVLATLLKVNRPAALVPIFVTNVFTVAPLFAATYWVGKLFWDGPAVKEVYKQLTAFAKTMYKLQFYEIFGQFKELTKMGMHVLIPMTIGGVIVGGILAAVSYPLTKSAVRKFRRFRTRRRKTKRKHMLLRRLHLDRLRLHVSHHDASGPADTPRKERHESPDAPSAPVSSDPQAQDMGREKT